MEKREVFEPGSSSSLTGLKHPSPAETKTYMSSWAKIGFFSATLGAGVFVAGPAFAVTEVSGFLSSAETWTKAQSPIVVTADLGTIAGGSLTIEPGVVVKIKPGVQMGFGIGPIIALGTESEPIIFTSYLDDFTAGDTNGDGNDTAPARGDWDRIVLGHSQNLIQNAEIKYGSNCFQLTHEPGGIVTKNKISACHIGFQIWGYAQEIAENEIFENGIGINMWFPQAGKVSKNKITDNSDIGIAVEHVGAPGTLIEENEISRNSKGIVVVEAIAGVTIHNNNIQDNADYGVKNTTPQYPVDATDNWWGNISGPFHASLNPGGAGNVVSDGILFNPWLNQEVEMGDGDEEPPPTGRRPVLIVPGILGTELKIGADTIWLDLSSVALQSEDSFLEVLAMDGNGSPINSSVFIGEVIKSRGINIFNIDFELNIFEDLLGDLESSGYKRETDLFFLPYDWRKSIQDNALILENKISDILDITGFDSLDIIAHSMGGLVSKAHIKSFGNDKVNKIIFVGTPHQGSVKAVKAILFRDQFGIFLLNQFTMKYLSKNMPSVYQLLPRQEYFDKTGGYLRPPDQLFTQNALSVTDTKDHIIDNGGNSMLYNQALNYFDTFPSDPDFGNIVVHNIIGCKAATIKDILIFDAEQGKYKLTPQSGDGTVPLVSADALSHGQKYFVSNSKEIHSELPSADGIRELIVQILTDEDVSLASNISLTDADCGLEGKTVSIHSPVELHVYDEFGNHSGPVEDLGIELSIPGVSYDILGDNKFVFLPTESGQTYEVELVAMDAGFFDARVSTYLDDDLQTTSFFNHINISALSKGKFSISSTSNDDTIELDFNGIGNYEDILADAIGNPDEADDFTPPEFLVYFDPEAENFAFSAEDDVDIELEIYCSTDECVAEDNVGNKTRLTFRQINLRRLHTLQLHTISYNGTEQDIRDNILIANYNETKTKINTFNQTFILERKELQRITYHPKKDQSTITTLNNGIHREIQPSVKFLQLETNQGKIKTIIK